MYRAPVEAAPAEGAPCIYIYIYIYVCVCRCIYIYVCILDAVYIYIYIVYASRIPPRPLEARRSEAKCHWALPWGSLGVLGGGAWGSLEVPWRSLGGPWGSLGEPCAPLGVLGGSLGKASRRLDLWLCSPLPPALHNNFGFFVSLLKPCYQISC